MATKKAAKKLRTKKPSKTAATSARNKVAEAVEPAPQPSVGLTDLRAEMQAAWDDLQHQQRRLRAASTYDNELIRSRRISEVLADVEKAQRRLEEATAAFEAQWKGRR